MTERGRRICVVGIIFAVLLVVGITYAGNSVLTSISAESREMNRDVVNSANMNATAVFPSAVVEGTYYFLLKVSFATTVPANTSYFFRDLVASAYFHSGPLSFPMERSFAKGDYYLDPEDEFLIKGEPTGGTVINFWNITIMMYVSPPSYTPGFSENQSLLSFTSQAETHLGIWLDANVDITAANGTNYGYDLCGVFDFEGNPTTFYMFSYPVWAWLGYGGSIIIVVASLLFLIHENRSRIAEKLREWFPSYRS